LAQLGVNLYRLTDLCEFLHSSIVLFCFDKLCNITRLYVHVELLFVSHQTLLLFLICKTLIDFVNINEGDSIDMKQTEEGEEVIVFDMKKMEQR